MIIYIVYICWENNINKKINKIMIICKIILSYINRMVYNDYRNGEEK